MSENINEKAAGGNQAANLHEIIENVSSNYKEKTHFKEASPSRNFNKKSFYELEQECRSAMAANGLPLNGDFIVDQEIHRYSCDHKNSEDEWYVAFRGISDRGNDYLNCVYGTWSEGQKYYFNSYEKNEGITNEERSAHKELWKQQQKQVEEKRIKEAVLRIDKAKSAWDAASDQPNQASAYIDRKQVKAHGIRFGSFWFNEGKKESPNWIQHPTLVIPLCNVRDEIQAIQHIRMDGEKRIYGIKKGCFHVIGQISHDSIIYIAEGYATSASVHEAIGSPVVVAFDCGNLDPVISALRSAYPNHKIIIARDDDVETENNPGKTKAEAASKKYSCTAIAPRFPENFRLPNGKKPTDWNDLHVHFNLEEVGNQLKKKQHLTPINIEAFLSLDLPPRKLILSPWLPQQGLAMIYAPRGIGKTFFSLYAAYAIASGGKMIIWNAPEPRRVLYVDGEMPVGSMQERLAKIVNGSARQPPDPSYFKLITPDLQQSGIRDLASKEGKEDINEHLEGVDVIFIDNLSALLRSGNENDAESWVPVQEWALSQRRAGKTVIFIHHAGKGGQQRGTSKREDILDTVIALKHSKDYAPSENARFEVHFEKARGFGGKDAEPFETSLILDEQGNQDWTFVELEGRDLEKIVQFAKEDYSQRDIAYEMNKSVGWVNKMIKEARLKGLLQEGEGTKSRSSKKAKQK